MIRTLGGLAWGIGVAILVMMLVEAAGNQLYPPPVGLDLERPDAAFRMPFRTLIFPVLGWFLGPLAGGMIAIRVSGRRWASWPVAAVVLVGAIVQFALAGYPLWMIAAGLAAPPAAALLAQLLVRPRAGDLAADPD